MGERTGDHSPTRHGVENYQSALAMKVRMLQVMHRLILDLLYATVDTYEARLPSKSFLDASEFDTVHPDNAAWCQCITELLRSGTGSYSSFKASQTWQMH
jgi:hypothetical protein